MRQLAAKNPRVMTPESEPKNNNTVSATCQQQRRSVIEYLNEACLAQLHGHPAPSLLPSTSQTT